MTDNIWIYIIGFVSLVAVLEFGHRYLQLVFDYLYAIAQLKLYINNELKPSSKVKTK